MDQPKGVIAVMQSLDHSLSKKCHTRQLESALSGGIYLHSGHFPLLAIPFNALKLG